MLSGDISTNLGPSKFPCSFWCCNVNSNHKSQQCDSCYSWSHNKCGGVSQRVYGELKWKIEFSWQCPSCLFSELQSFDAFEDSFDVKGGSSVDYSSASVGKVIKISSKGIQLIHHNVQGLLSKLPELCQWLHESTSPTILCCSETWLKTDNLV